MEFVIALIVSLLLTGMVRKQAIRKHIIDIPNERSSHSVPTPRGGGLAIAIVWYCGLILFFFLGKIDAKLFYALSSGLVLSITSFIDDVKDLSPKIRILAQFVSSALALIALGGVTSLDIGFISLENRVVLTLLAIPFIIWFINLFNFLDGIDGYLGMEALFVSIGMWLFTGNTVLLLLAAAILGFLVWNWPLPKAKIFCGDVGSTLIGFNVAIFAIYFQNIHQLSLIVPLILSALFWFDASLTLFRRWRNKEKLSVAHRKHAYQRIVQSGFSHAKTVYFAIIVNLVLVAIAYAASIYTQSLLIIFGTTVLGLWLIVRLVDKRKAFAN